MQWGCDFDTRIRSNKRSGLESLYLSTSTIEKYLKDERVPESHIKIRILLFLCLCGRFCLLNHNEFRSIVFSMIWYIQLLLFGFFGSLIVSLFSLKKKYPVKTWRSYRKGVEMRQGMFKNVHVMTKERRVINHRIPVCT